MIIAIIILYILIIIVYHPYLEKERNSYLLYIENLQEKEKDGYKPKN